MAMRRAIARRAKAIAIPLAITPLTPSVVVVIFVSPLMVFIVLPFFSPILTVVLFSFLVLSVSSLFFLSVFLLLLLSISLPLLAISLLLPRVPRILGVHLSHVWLGCFFFSFPCILREFSTLSSAGI